MDTMMNQHNVLHCMAPMLPSSLETSSSHAIRTTIGLHIFQTYPFWIYVLWEYLINMVYARGAQPFLCASCIVYFYELQLQVSSRYFFVLLLFCFCTLSLLPHLLPHICMVVFPRSILKEQTVFSDALLP